MTIARLHLVLACVAVAAKAKFVPEAVEDAEGHREADTEDPGEIPHALLVY